MTKIIITGNADEACAKLKATLDVQDAAFEANLSAMFKPTPPPRAPAASAAEIRDSSGWSLATKRSRTWR